MAPIFDLRFVIGSFFTIVGLILLVAGSSVNGTLGSGVPSATINLISGAAMTAFGLLMFLLSFIYRKK